jgi:hypothetical protein
MIIREGTWDFLGVIARLPECGILPHAGRSEHAEFFRTPALLR